jgi:Fe-S cluster biogenesis protein NfuA
MQALRMLALCRCFSKQTGKISLSHRDDNPLQSTREPKPEWLNTGSRFYTMWHHGRIELARLVITSDSDDPVLKGECSACPDVKFVLNRDVPSCLRLMHEMFDRHFTDVHSETS